MNRFLIFALALLTACDAPPPAVATDGPALTGEALAATYCGNCHQLPTPDQLDRPTWERYVLPRMGYTLGIYPHDSVRASLLEDNPGGARVVAANIFPEKPALPDSSWQKIRQYYLTEAPDTLPRPSLPPLVEGLAGFQVRTPTYRLSPPSTTLVHIADVGQLLVGDAHTQRLYAFDGQLRLQNAANVREGAVALRTTPDHYWLTVMGSFSPTDNPTGLLLQLPRRAGGAARVVLRDLQRPVHAAYADLDGDGREDIVTCEFGKWTGGLAWWQQRPDGQYEKRWLRQVSGATRAYVRDLNADGRPDVLALFGQGDEGLFAFYNEGDGQFRSEAVLRFPPSYGSSFFTLFDWDGDGHQDILYTAGDNADYPPLLKPYHGVYCFRNDGTGRFRQAWFEPLPGAYAAQPADYDGDGDPDFAAISFFPDYTGAARESFIYFENQGDGTFVRSTFAEATDGRWIVMDSGDLDGDGDLDLVLGSLAFEVIPAGNWVERWVAGGLPFVVLENTRQQPVTP